MRESPPAWKMNSIKAKQVPIRLVLEKLGCPPPVKRTDGFWYKSPFRNEKTASLKIFENANTFNDFGGHYHGNVVDLVMQKYNCDFRQALEKFENWARGDSEFIPEAEITRGSRHTPRRQVSILENEEQRSDYKPTKTERSL